MHERLSLNALDVDAGIIAVDDLGTNHASCFEALGFVVAISLLELIETINTVGNVHFTENVADFYQARNKFKTMVCESISNDFVSQSPIHSLKRTLDFDFCGYAILCNGLLVNMQHLFAQCQQIMGVTDEEIKAYYDERKQIKAGIKDTDTKSSSKMNELMQLQKEIDEARQNGSVQQPKPRQTRPEGTTLP